VHARRSSKPFRVNLSNKRVPNAFQSLNEFVLEARLGIKRVARVKHREQILDYITILLPSDVRESLHGYVILGTLEPTDDILSHLGLILTIAERASVLEGLNNSRLKCTAPTAP
jgi:hypothetical protein